MGRVVPDKYDGVSSTYNYTKSKKDFKTLQAKVQHLETRLSVLISDIEGLQNTLKILDVQKPSPETRRKEFDSFMNRMCTLIPRESLPSEIVLKDGDYELYTGRSAKEITSFDKTIPVWQGPKAITIYSNYQWEFKKQLEKSLNNETSR